MACFNQAWPEGRPQRVPGHAPKVHPSIIIFCASVLLSAHPSFHLPNLSIYPSINLPNHLSVSLSLSFLILIYLSHLFIHFPTLPSAPSSFHPFLSFHPHHSIILIFPSIPCHLLMSHPSLSRPSAYPTLPSNYTDPFICPSFLPHTILQCILLPSVSFTSPYPSIHPSIHASSFLPSSPQPQPSILHPSIYLPIF